VETIKRQTELRVAVWLQVKVCGRELSLLYARALSVTQKFRCSRDMRLVALYKRYTPLPFAVVCRVSIAWFID